MGDKAKILEALGKLDPKNDNHWTTEGLARLDTVRMLASDQEISREDVEEAAPGFTKSEPTLPETQEGSAPTTPAAPPAPGGEGGETPPEVPPQTQEQTVLVGSDNFDANIDINGQDVQLGEIVAAAHEASELSVVEFNDLDDEKRDALIQAEIDKRLEPVSPPEDNKEEGEDDEEAPEATEEELEELEEELDTVSQEILDARAEQGEIENHIAKLEKREQMLSDKLSELRPPEPSTKVIGQYLASRKKTNEERGEIRQKMLDSGVDLKELGKLTGKAPIDAAMARKNQRGTKRPTRGKA